MSMEAKYYTIAGYDLTDIIKNKDVIFDDDALYDTWVNEKNKDSIYLYVDSASGGHVLLGHEIASGDEFYFKTQKKNLLYLKEIQYRVDRKLEELHRIGFIDLDIYNLPEYEIISFCEMY